MQEKLLVKDVLLQILFAGFFTKKARRAHPAKKIKEESATGAQRRRRNAQKCAEKNRKKRSKYTEIRRIFAGAGMNRRCVTIHKRNSKWTQQSVTHTQKYARKKRNTQRTQNKLGRNTRISTWKSAKRRGNAKKHARIRRKSARINQNAQKK